MYDAEWAYYWYCPGEPSTGGGSELANLLAVIILIRLCCVGGWVVSYAENVVPEWFLITLSN